MMVGRSTRLTMLDDYLTLLSEELDLEPPLSLNDQKEVIFSISDKDILLKDLSPGFYCHAPITPLPEKKREDIFMQIMQANLLGQGTGGSIIGSDQDEKNLTLSLHIPYEINYSTFKEKVEDFVNYLLFWQEKIESIEKEALL